MTTTGAKLLRSFISLCILLSYVPIASPQTSTTGAITGRLFEEGPISKGVSGATVVITNEFNGLSRSINTTSFLRLQLSSLDSSTTCSLFVNGTALGIEFKYAPAG